MIVVETFLICDGDCGINFGVDNRYLNGRQHRQLAHECGWVKIKNKDYCPDCKPLIQMSPREKQLL